MPGRRLDLATDQLVLPEGSDQPFPVPRGQHCRHSPMPGEDALLKLLGDLNHRITNLVNLIALPWNGQESPPAPAPSCPCGNVQSPMTTGVVERPTTTAGLL